MTEREKLDPDAATGCADDFLPGSADQWRAAAEALSLRGNVERVADAIEAVMGPVFGSPEYLADPVKLARAEKRRRDGALAYARAALSAMPDRQAERDAIVAWLRQQSDIGADLGNECTKGTTMRAAYGGGSLMLHKAADAIENGEHLKEAHHG